MQASQLILTEKYCKRILDLLLSSVAIILLLPLLMAIALIILMIDGWPIIYSECRIGYHRRLFTLYKFRTLDHDSYLPTVASSDDTRITLTGRHLRRCHVDELLQLWNVIKGDMSLVGPRPMKPEHVVTLHEDTVNLLLSVKPGLTGPASILFIAEDEALAGFNDSERLYVKFLLPVKANEQVSYVLNYSFGLDLKLIMQTIHDLFSTRAHAKSKLAVRALLPPRT